MTATVFGYLQNTTNFPVSGKQVEKAVGSQKVKKRYVLALAARIVQIFGSEETFAGKLNKKLCDLVKNIKDVFGQMRTGFKNGYSTYDQDTFPAVREIKSYCPIGLSVEEFFNSIKEYSYGTLPIPQMMLLYPEYDAKAFNQMMNTRKIGLEILCSRLIDPIPQQVLMGSSDFVPSKRVSSQYKAEESKEEQKEAKVPQEQKDFALAQLLLSDAEALPGVSFRDLLATWAEKEQVSTGHIFERLRLEQWLSKPKRGVALERFRAVERGSFREFLINCTIKDLQDKLGVYFPLSMKEKLREAFQDESVRSEVAYVTTLLPGDLEKIPWESLNPFSQQLLNSILTFHFFIEGFAVEEREQTPLFQMVFFGNKENLPISQIRENAAARSLEENQRFFSAAWECMDSLIISIQENQPGNPSLYQNPQLLPFFAFLLCSDEMVLNAWETIFRSFRNQPKVTLSLSVIENFCRANPSISPQCADVFLDRYCEIIEIAALPSDLENLCFHPPLALDSSAMLSLGRITENHIRGFLEAIEEYSFSVPQVVELLRRRIFDTGNFLTMLAILKEDVEKLGISHVDTWKVLTAQPNYRALPSPEMREKACKIVMEARQSSPFLINDPLEHYLEILRLDRSKMVGVNQFFLELQRFFPDLGPIHKFFFLRYCSDLSELRELLKAREEFLQNFYEESENLYMNSAPFSAEVDKAIEIDEEKPSFLKSCPLEDRGVYQRQFEEAFYSAVRYPSQPLSDFFQILDINEKDHIQFIPGFQNRLGRLKTISPFSPRQVYVNWNWFNGKLVLSTTVRNRRDCSARTASVGMPLEREEINSPECKGAFFGFLFGKSQEVFLEPTGEILAEPSIEEDVRGVPRELAQRGLQFLIEAKVRYRALFFPELRKDPSPDLEPWEVAAEGNIYPLGRGSLLPEAWLQLETDPSYYLPAADEEFIMELYKEKRFSQNCPKTPLKLVLRIKVRGEEKQFPVFYKVHTVVDSSCVILQFDLPNPGARESMQIPLLYPPEAFKNPTLHRELFEFQLHQFMAAAYQTQLPYPQIPYEQGEEKEYSHS